MTATRRQFISTSLIAGAGVAMPGKALAKALTPEKMQRLRSL